MLLRCSALRASSRAFFAPRSLASSSPLLNYFSTASDGDIDYSQGNRMRNIGISAHIDSGKTTLTERILFYTGRINAIHDVRGKDGVGAKMDSMDLEREKGITIQSAATSCHWMHNNVKNLINIIDTPGHVDFTIEVERALRVLDGAIMVLCGVSGVQSQSLTVDRQMKRYNVPRIAFINKLDRMGANPTKVVEAMKDMLKLNAAAVQVPIGLEGDHRGVVDLVNMRSLLFEGDNGEVVVEGEVPTELAEEVAAKRHMLIEAVADADDEIAELFLMEEEPEPEQLRAAIRRCTMARTFVPVFLGSAFKNRGVQPMLDGVVEYLPAPAEVENFALEVANDENLVSLSTDPAAPLLALAFKLEDGKFGQLTYMRIYQGTLARGSFVYNVQTRKRMKVPRVVRMHSNDMEELEVARAGDVVAMFGVECSSMDTFTSDKDCTLAMTSMHVPAPVLSLAVKNREQNAQFSKAIQKFTREDPTFRTHVDDNTQETIISGMGELHLQIYVERMRREYNLDVEVGEPQVNFREAVQKRASFDYLHKKQSGGSGQYARVIGYIEPLEDDFEGNFEFLNEMVGNAISPEYITACQKGLEEAVAKGGLAGHPVQRVRMVLQDGATHAVDSSELAFKTATIYAFRQAFVEADGVILEPQMSVEVEVPTEFQGATVGNLNRRKGLIESSEDDGAFVKIRCVVPLSTMFGYSTDLRSSTQGKGEFTMEYKEHAPVARELQAQLIKDYQKKRAAGDL